MRRKPGFLLPSRWRTGPAADLGAEAPSLPDHRRCAAPRMRTRWRHLSTRVRRWTGGGEGNYSPLVPRLGVPNGDVSIADSYRGAGDSVRDSRTSERTRHQAVMVGKEARLLAVEAGISGYRPVPSEMAAPPLLDMQGLRTWTRHGQAVKHFGAAGLVVRRSPRGAPVIMSQLRRRRCCSRALPAGPRTGLRLGWTAWHGTGQAAVESPSRRPMRLSAERSTVVRRLRGCTVGRRRRGSSRSPTERSIGKSLSVISASDLCAFRLRDEQDHGFGTVSILIFCGRQGFA
ncbi:hypothetical protein DFJ74DRAFT_660123 [Hyaloraphidium curvatum]|nr:hypothetical protein DFJ74DRAFT_660123 [Hyaloraphidium curvatum]